jgi:hypothetical protein
MKLCLAFALAAVPALVCVACASTIPKAELDRCKLGVADGNDGYTVRQGAACASVAKRLAADEEPAAALGYARKACDLEDARGCEEYLTLVRGQPSLAADELQRARAAGEKACAGMVLAVDGADARPTLCVSTAQLYEDLAPTSPGDAGRLYARACKLGDDRSCARASKLGADLSDHTVSPKVALPLPKAMPNAPAVAQPLPAPGPRPPAPPPAAPVPACHEMRPCVTLEVTQRNFTEVVGSLSNHCDRAVACSWCPAHREQVDRGGGCRSVTLSPNEKRTGRESGLWYDGYDSIAYDCMDAADARACLAL